MKRPMMTATTAMFLGVVTLAPAVVSAAPETRAQERALERLQRAASEHVRILTELSAKLPEQFQADLAPAIGAASQGLAQAQSAVAPAAAQAAIEVTEPTDGAATRTRRRTTRRMEKRPRATTSRTARRPTTGRRPMAMTRPMARHPRTGPPASCTPVSGWPLRSRRASPDSTR
jgi:hypothetical protein